MKKGIDIHEASYHPDGKYEGLQSDNMPTSQIGVRSDTHEKESPFNVTSLAEDPEMEKFKRLLGSKRK